MPYNVTSYNYPYGTSYGTPYNNSQYYDNPLSNVIWGAGIAPLFGISPLLGAGLGFLLGSSGGQNTNVININTRRRWNGFC